MFSEKLQVPIKDGRTAMLRPASAEDADAYYEMERSIIEAGEGVVLSLDDLGDAELYRKRFAQRLGFLNGVGCIVLAEVDGVLAGNGTVRQMFPRGLRHVGDVAIGVHPDFQGLGIGNAILTQLLILAGAIEAPAIWRLELRVHACNERARNLYRKFGFEDEAVCKDYHALPDGRVCDDIIMVQFLNGADARSDGDDLDRAA